MSSFIAIYNQSGIACASDTDNTVFRLSKQEPLAVAICPDSPIPWEKYIQGYIRKGEPQHHKALEDYARDFETYIQQFPADPVWNNLDIYLANIIFFGYGQDDIYPSCCDIQIKVNVETGKIEFAEACNTLINIKDTAWHSWNGDFECLAPILRGATDQVRDYAVAQEIKLYDAYRQRVINKFKGTKFEEYVMERMAMSENEAKAVTPVEDASMSSLMGVHKGIDTFSIEEMVTSAERLVDANDRLLHLKNGGKGLVKSTREIAVLTRVEGFTWIKHSLFAI